MIFLWIILGIVGVLVLWFIAVFNGIIEPFAVNTHKKLKLQKGNIGDLSRWYPPFYRIFKLWKNAPVE